MNRDPAAIAAAVDQMESLQYRAAGLRRRADELCARARRAVGLTIGQRLALCATAWKARARACALLGLHRMEWKCIGEAWVCACAADRFGA